MTVENLTESKKLEILDSKPGGSEVTFKESKENSQKEMGSDWSTRCCCTSRMKFEEVDTVNILPKDQVVEESASSQDSMGETASNFTGYRRESVFSAISEFESKLLTLGMAEEGSGDGEESDSEKSDFDSAFRRRSDFVQRPLIINSIGVRRATAPQTIQTDINIDSEIPVNEETTEE